MSDSVVVECPNCGRSQRTNFSPMMYLSFEATITIDYVSCSDCGYEGEP